MAFITLHDPYVPCPACFCRIRVPDAVLAEPEGAGSKHTVQCECGALWGFDNYPALRPYRAREKEEAGENHHRG